MKALGPSLLHSLGGLAAMAIILAARWAATGNPTSSAFYGAGIVSAWFLAREVEQIAPHLGWRSWRIDLSNGRGGRLLRQAGIPFLATHAAAFAVRALA